MKHYSVKTPFFDKREWKKHILNLELKTDALFNYINLNNPNYFIINWNAEDYPTSDRLMKMTSKNISKGAIYSHSNLDYYFLKCFNNNDIIWGKTNIRFINDFPTIDLIQRINSGSETDSKGEKFTILPEENSWLFIDSNEENGYKFLPSSSGYGNAYTIKWVWDDIRNKYIIEYKSVNNSKNFQTYFFNKPTQTRWDSFNQRTVEDSNLIIDWKDIQKLSTGEYYQGQKQWMHKTLKSNSDNSYEYVYADNIYEENTITEYIKIKLATKNNINMEVYYW